MSLLRKDKLAGMLKDEETLATTLMVICLDTWGTEFFDWEPAAFDLELRGRYGTEMPRTNHDKLWGLVTAMTTNLFYISLESFIPIANALNGAEANFQYYDPVTSEEAAWAITEVLLNDAPAEGKDPAKQFSHEIKQYIGFSLRSEGVTNPPAVLKPYAEIPADLEERAGASMGPDESMVKMYTDRQARERNEINQYVNERIDQLGAQLQLLPLVNGDTAGLLDHLRQAKTDATGLSLPAEPGTSVLPYL